MPEAMTADTPATRPPFADTLANNNRPALSASSDMPIIIDPANALPNDADAETAKPVDDGGKSADKVDTDDKSSGEPTDGDLKSGDADQTPPGVKAAMSRLRNERRAAEQRATTLETQLSQALQAISKLTGETDKPKEDPRPARDAFDSPDAYDKALEGWAGRQATQVATAAAKAEQARQEQARQVSTLVEAYTTRKSSFEADHPDFDDVVLSEDLKISPPMSQAILEAEDGPAIAYHLGQNPEVAERISKLSPAQAVYEIGRISTRLANPAKPKPEPIRPLAARNAATEKSPDEMSMDEYVAYRAKKAN